MIKTSSLFEKRARTLQRVKRKQPTPPPPGAVPQNSLRESIAVGDLSALVDGFVITADIERHSVRTQANKRERLSRLVWFAEHKNWAVIGVRELQAFFLYLNHGHEEPGGRWGSARSGKCSDSAVSSSTVKTYYATYRAFFRWCVREGELDICPMDRIKPPIDRSDQVQPFTAAQMLLLESATKKSHNSTRDEAIHFLLLDT